MGISRDTIDRSMRLDKVDHDLDHERALPGLPSGLPEAGSLPVRDFRPSCRLSEAFSILPHDKVRAAG